MSSRGYLHIISGSTFSGKTSSLVNQYNTFKSSVLVFNHCLDDRYDPNNAYIITHDRARIPCTSIAHIRDVFDHPDFGSVETIMIDEIQFFTGIKRDILEMVETHGKRVVLAGLLTDVHRNFFGELNELIPVADRY
jgi:thymidine kinase